MLRMKHREEANSTEHDEQRIREDERRRVMEELREDRGHDGGDGDWRTTPPRSDEARYDDPARAAADDRVIDDRAGDRRVIDARGDDRRVADDRVADRRVVDDRYDDRVGDRRVVDDRADDPRAWDGRDRRAVSDGRDVPPVQRTDRDDDILERRPWMAAEEETVTERGFSPGQILLVLAGAASLALGIAAVAMTGLDGPLSEPVDEVLGWNHTALLGLIEIGAGVVMILSGVRAGSRWLGGLVGLAAIVGGALILGRLDWTMDELGAERGFGWVAIAIGAVAVIGAAIPRVRRRSRRMSHTQSSQLLTH